MKEPTKEDSVTTASNIAFIYYGDGEPVFVGYGTLVSLVGKKGNPLDMRLVWKFDDGSLGFLLVDSYLQCGKQKLNRVEEIDFGEMYFYYDELARELEKIIMDKLKKDDK